jgi:hypothetical protein
MAGWGLAPAMLGTLALGLAGSADIDNARLRLSDKVAVPGQVVVASGTGLKKAKVTIGGKKPRVLSRSKRRVSFQVPSLKPGRYRVVVRAHGHRRSGRLRVTRGFGGKLSVTLDASRAAAGDIGPEGGAIAATGSNGTRYELMVPPGALDVATHLTVTPIVRAGGLPGGGSTRNGVRFAPDGLRFAKPAELRVTAAHTARGPVGLIASDDGANVVFESGRKDGSAFVLDIPHFSTAATANMTLQDFRNLLAQWAHQTMTLQIAAQFFDMLPDFNHGGFCNQDQTCRFVRAEATGVIADFATSPSAGGPCRQAAQAAFIWQLEATARVILQIEGNLALAGVKVPAGLADCRNVLVTAMYDLIHDTAPTDPLAVSGPCAGSPGDADHDGHIQEIECAVRIAGLAEELASPSVRELVLEDIRAGLRKILDDGTRQCEQAKQFEEGEKLLIRGAQYGQALADGGALRGLDGEFDTAIRECEPKVTVSPSGPSVEIGQAKDFTATSEEPGDTSFTWSADKGTIDGSGHFTAPTEPGPVVVKATSAKPAWFPTSDGPNRSGKTTVSVTCPAGKVPFTPAPGQPRECRVLSIDISPTDVTVDTGHTQQFTAGVHDADDKRVDWSVSAGGGTITQQSGSGLGGLYTASNTPGTYTVTAVSRADPAKQATASVTVNGSGTLEVVTRSEEVHVKNEGGYAYPPGSDPGDFIDPESRDETFAGQPLRGHRAFSTGAEMGGSASVGGANAQIFVAGVHSSDVDDAGGQLALSVTSSASASVTASSGPDEEAGGKASSYMHLVVTFQVSDAPVQILCSGSTDTDGAEDAFNSSGTLFVVSGAEDFVSYSGTAGGDQSAELPPGSYTLEAYTLAQARVGVGNGGSAEKAFGAGVDISCATG